MMFGNAEAYDRFMGRWSRLMAPLLVDFAGVPESGQILDVGTGIGSLAFEVARRNRALQVTGVDPSREFVAFAMSRNPFPEQARFAVEDAQELHLENEKFAASFSSLVFNFIPDAAKALREVRRVTRRGGRVAAAVWDYGEGMRMLRVFWDAAITVDPHAERLDEKHMPLCHHGDLTRMWAEGGLENVDEQPLEITMRFACFADYWEPFHLGQGPAGAYVRTLAAGSLEALRRALKQKLSISSDEAAFTLPARVWAVRGNVPG